MGMSVSWKLLHSYLYVLFEIALGKVNSFTNTIADDFPTED